MHSISEDAIYRALIDAGVLPDPKPLLAWRSAFRYHSNALKGGTLFRLSETVKTRLAVRYACKDALGWDRIFDAQRIDRLTAALIAAASTT